MNMQGIAHGGESAAGNVAQGWEADAGESAPRKKLRWAWIIWLLLVLIGMIGVGIGASWLVRSEWFLRRQLDPKLEALGERLGGV